MTATQIYRNRIAVVFDFDLTLAPDSFSTLLRYAGVKDPAEWRRRHVQPLVRSGQETILARIHALTCLAGSGEGSAITAELVREAGCSIVPYEGVPDMFDTLRRVSRDIAPGLEVEFYLLTSGFVDLHRVVSFAGEFTATWGTEFHFNERGALEFPKCIVTHPEKARYILQLSKGIGTDGPNGPADAYRDVPDEQIHVPLDQVIYVGDGGSDMAAFALLHQHGGIAIAVYKAEQAQDWDGLARIDADRRVQNLAPADYRAGSELMESLCLAVRSIGYKIALRRLGKGE